MAKEIELIILERAGKAYPDGSTPGTLHVGDRKFPTIERGGGYVNLKVGDYVMEHSRKRTGRPIRCLRPVESTIEAILIHAAYKDNSEQLEGCVSPGMMKKPPPGMGILQADAAMEEIWKLLGGWKEGKKVTLHVANNAPGDARIKEVWDRVRDPRLRKLR
jgi:hypothetical protein